jgi:hypothetical protein
MMLTHNEWANYTAEQHGLNGVCCDYVTFISIISSVPCVKFYINFVFTLHMYTFQLA